MTEQVEHTGSGYVVRDASGKTIVTIALSTGPEPGCGALVVLAGEHAVEIPLSLQSLKHGETVFGRHYRAALFAKTAVGGPRVPRQSDESFRV